MEKEIELITNYLDKLGKALGLGTEKLWPYLIKQQYVEAVFSTIFFIVFLAASIWIIRFIMKHWQFQEEGIYSICQNDHFIYGQCWKIY
jgi:hypothetical protein